MNEIDTYLDEMLREQKENEYPSKFYGYSDDEEDMEEEALWA